MTSWGWLFVWACVAAGSGGEPERGRVPTYTNEDLERARARREETGVRSEPAVPFGDVLKAASRPGNRLELRAGEAYWRGEAARHRRRREPLAARLAALERKLEERRRKPGVRPYSDPVVQATTARIEELRRQLREMEERFLDRARREGALPGWLR